MHDLKKRGILLAVCSKNDQAVALRPFREHPDMILKEEDITVFIANWQNKAENIRSIKEILNIGYDSMVFLDDNSFERQTVREQLPELIVPELPEDPALFLRALAELNLFESASHSELDGERSSVYREQAQRQVAEKSFSDPAQYLKSLEMKISLSRFDDLYMPRIVQLMQRSNQFNLMTCRFNQAECEKMRGDLLHYYPFYVKLQDKYGDNGLISVVILKLEGRTIEIIEWLMSCRVLVRGVEQFTMNFVFELAVRHRAEKVAGRYRATDKNAMVKDFYVQFGFQKTACGPEETAWELEVPRYRPAQTYMTQENQII